MVQQDLCVAQGKIRGYCIMVTNDIIVSNFNQLLYPMASLQFSLVQSRENEPYNSGMLLDSGLLNQLQQHSFDTGGRPLCIYGDPAYPLRVHLQSGFRGANIREEELRNSKMSSVRQAVERIFADIVNFFKFLDFKKNLKIGLSPVGKMYIVSTLLHNDRSCFYATITSKYFECNHQLLKHILHISRDFIILLSNSCFEFSTQT